MPGDIGRGGGSGGKVLIEEVVPPSETSGDKGETKGKKKKGAAVKKGFLNSAGKSGPKLYGDDGSSGDGQKEVSSAVRPPPPSSLPLVRTYFAPQYSLMAFL